jgi:hypothetical protein
MRSEPPELGKGLFGYRKSAVNQIIADRDVMLRQAEGRVRAAESKVAELEAELGAMRDRNARMDDQLERLRLQFEAMSHQSEGGPFVTAPDDWEGAVPTVEPETGSSLDEESSEPAEPFPTPADDMSQYYATAIPPSDAQAGGADAREESSAWLLEPMEDEQAGEGAAPGEEGSFEMQGQDAGTVEEPETKFDYEPYDSAFEADDMLRSGEESGEAIPDSSYESAYGEPEAVTDEAQESVWGAVPESEASWTLEPELEEESARAPDVTAEVDEEGPPEPRFEPHPVITDQPWTFSQTEADTPEEAIPSPQASGEAPAPSHEAVPAEPAPQPTEDITSRFLREELGEILKSAEESAARIVERARTTTQHQIAQSNRLWREVQNEVSRFAAWREEVEPVINTVQSKVSGVRTQIEEIPERIRQALAPMADAISSVDADLAELVEACSPPLLLTPSGLEGSEGAVSWEVHTSDEGAQEVRGGDDEGHGDVGLTAG